LLFRGDVARSFFFAKVRSVIVVIAGVAAAIAARGDVGIAAITTATPYEVFASGFEDPSGLAVQPDGTVLLTDRRAGTLMRIGADGVRQIILRNLHQPRGVASGSGGVFVLEEARVLRLEPNGIVSVVSVLSGQARAITADPDGRIWIAVRREKGVDDEILRLEASGLLTRVASGFILTRALAADTAGIYVAAYSIAGQPFIHTTVVRLPFRADGGLGPFQRLFSNTPGLADGLAVDAAGDVFVTGWFGPPYPASGVVLKPRAGGEVGLVASGMWWPGAAAFGPGRDLFVVERRAPARVLRFRPPPPPVVNVPPFTNRMPVPIEGRAPPASLVEVMRAAFPGPVLTTSTADVGTGAFAASASLPANAETRLLITATASGGNGLVGRPAIASVVHDDHLPVVAILEPPATAYVRDVVALSARAADEGSGMATLQLLIDQATVASAPTAARGEPLAVSAFINMTSFREGPHTLTSRGVDRAGNWAAAARLLVVDRTPPDTFVLTGPPVETADRGPIFTFGGSDEQSPDLEFAWRLDGGPWSPFSATPAVALTGLAGGPHRFEVVARDRAGNVDATPAAQAFTVIALRVRIAEPIAGSAVSTQTAWVRGTIEGPEDVAVSLPLPEVYRKALALEALAAPHEAGTFAAEVPVVPGMTSLSVVVRDLVGGVATDTVAITVQAPLSSALRLQPFPPAGLAPHTVRFPANAFPAGSVYSLDLESDGITDYAGNAVADQEFVYTRPGIYLVTLRIATPDGRMLVARGAIEVYDRARLEARLQAVWAGFKGALGAGNAAAAAAFLHSDRRAAWAEYFSRLTPAQFAATDTTFTDIVLLEVTPGRAECEMMRDVGGLLYSFPVSFEIDVDGGWKLWQF
jgi:sugar lactone lactonase YvrE